MSGPDLTIAVLLPDVLGTYSDAGNAVVLAQRARRRGLTAEIMHVTADSTPPATCELYLLGGGEDTAQAFATDWLTRHRDLLHTMSHSAQTFAVCAGLQILGRYVTDSQGRRHNGLGLLDLTTAPGRRRAVGEVITRCELPGVGLLTGFENHRGTSAGGAGLHPLGRVLSGVGNGDRAVVSRARTEGAVTERLLATYLHGPVLARNPALADHLLHRVTGLADTELPEPPDLPELRRTYLASAPRRRVRTLLSRPLRRR
ncbi:MAG: glutamine amidotransferase [Pseudonocardia sp.]|nr:glutamine amidotransferase [Pseudonocardia sp.]